MAIEAFFQRMADMAIPICRGTGIFVSVVLGQAYGETGGGAGSQLDEYHNWFGMMSALTSDYPWSGPSVTADTFEYYDGKTKTPTKAAFRVYDSDEACIRDYVGYLTTAKKYALVSSCDTPEEQITLIHKTGYATDPKYSQKIIDIIRKYNLKRYDEVKILKKYPEYDHRSYIDSKGQAIPKGNAREFLAFHYLGVDGQNWELFNGRFGGHDTIFWAGGIHHRVPYDGVIYHVGASSGYTYKHPTARNCNTIGVEMCPHCAGDSTTVNPYWYFTQETQEAAVQLARDIFLQMGWPLTKEEIDKRVLMHGSITTKICPAPWILSPHYRTNWSFDEFKEAIRTGICPGGCISEAEIKAIQEKFFKVGFDCGCKEDKDGILQADGDWGKGSKSDCRDFANLYKLEIPADGYPTQEILNKLDEVIQYADVVTFHPDYYAAKYPDLAKAGLKTNAQLLAHFVNNGLKEGRQGTVVFNPKYYAKQYEDIKKAFGSDYKAMAHHFITNGTRECRRGSKEFSVVCYRKNYKDLRDAFGTDYEMYYRHYVLHGIHEGRVANKTLK